MRKPSALAVLTIATLALAACGSADDASVEASADTVEMPADSALAPVSDAPVADPSATATDAPAVAPATAEQAGDAAETVVDDVLEAAGEETPSE